MSTKPAKEAITILNKSNTGHLVSSREFITVRNFLIARLELENTQRPGPMETASVSNLRDAERSDDGSYTMNCPKHKRSLDGPAQIDMDAETRANVCTYVEDVLLGLNTSVATRSRSETKAANSAKSNEEESEPSIQDEGLSSGQVKVIEMLFSN